VDLAITALPYDQSRDVAERVARDRPDEVDPDATREVFFETATLLHNGLVLDGHDELDAHSLVAGLAVDLLASDPGAAIRDRSRRVLETSGVWREPEAASRSLLIAAATLRL
jgi:hypothetical protein